MRGRLLSAGLLGLLFLPATAPAHRPAPTFVTGLYAGTTSQHEKFSFAVRNERQCGRRAGLCFYTVGQANILIPCASGDEPANAYADPGPLLVPRSGIIRDRIKLFATVDTYIKLDHHRHATGDFRATDSPTCAKKVTLTARRVHR